MSKKKQTIVLSVIGAATVLVLMVGVTFAYFTSTMRGEAANTNVSTKLIGGISFTAQAVDGSEILPGWTSGAKTVTVTAEASDVDMEYSCTLNITENGLTDLKLTLSGDNYVTENNNATLGTTAVTIARGTIPAREEVATKTMTYTISLPETGENQTEGNSGKNFAATVSCKLDNEIRYYEGSNNVVATNFYDKLLADNPTRLTRTSFDATFVDTNAGTLYTQSGNWTEGGNTVYYFAGQAQNNWVKFGKAYESVCTYNGNNVIYGDLSNHTMKEFGLTEDECVKTQICKVTSSNGNLEIIDRDIMYGTGIPESYCNDDTLSGFLGEGHTYEFIKDYATYSEEIKDLYWRIIRTNEDGSIRLLYMGSNKATNTGVITEGHYNATSSDNQHDSYIGYMYGSDGSLENHRTNTNDSKIKTFLDNWYRDNLNILLDGSYTYDSYISKTAIYCNDRSTDSWNYGSGSRTSFAAYNRLENGRPSYKCGVDENGNLYSTASRADKFSVSTTNGGNGDLTYPIALITADELAYIGVAEHNGDQNGTDLYSWHVTNSNGEEMHQSFFTMTPRWCQDDGVSLSCTSVQAYSKFDVAWYLNGVRPVISLKSCALTTGGNGSSTSPYEITIDETCETAEN